MSDFFSILIVIILSLLGLSFVPSVTGLGVAPLLSLFFVIGLTYFKKGAGPILISALSGLILDFFSSSPFGLHLGLFLMVAVVIRLFFQEGMNELPFGHYLAISAGALVAYFAADALFLYFLGGGIKILELLIPFIKFTVVNLVGCLLVYAFNVKYFDSIMKFEHNRR